MQRVILVALNIQINSTSLLRDSNSYISKNVNDNYEQI